MQVQVKLQVVLKEEFGSIKIPSFPEKFSVWRGERGCVVITSRSSSLNLLLMQIL